MLGIKFFIWIIFFYYLRKCPGNYFFLKVVLTKKSVREEDSSYNILNCMIYMQEFAVTLMRLSMTYK